MSEVVDPTPFFSTLYSRRSIRHYEKRPVEPPLIQKLLEAATWAPSAHNRQPWRFAILTDQDVKRRLASRMGERLRTDLTADGLASDLIEADVDRSIRRLSNAPVIVVISLSLEDMDSYPDARRRQYEWQMAVQSTAMAGQNLLLSAHALGLGACWMCAPLFCPETVRGVLDLPDSWQPQGLITLGYPAEERIKSRLPVRDVTIYYQQDSRR